MINYFRTRYKIMPVYSMATGKQVSVLVQVKPYNIGFWCNAQKDCVNPDGILEQQDAIFDTMEDAEEFVKALITEINLDTTTWRKS